MRALTDRLCQFALLMVLVSLCVRSTLASTNVALTQVPDYGWYYACMGTAAGNLMGFWDRHGFPDFYTGPTGDIVAPLNSSGANEAVVSMWASPGHLGDYYVDYDSAQPDPFLAAPPPGHEPDCIGDFIGMDQLRWTNMANECNGNIDGFCFVYWDTNGDRRVNFVPDTVAGVPACDVQSGLRAWTQYRGYDCTVFTQLVDFNPTVPAGKGFTFQDLKAEIDGGYPVLLFLQEYGSLSRTVNGVPNLNPEIHSMLAYGYYISGTSCYVRYRTSWASGDSCIKPWTAGQWEAGLPVRGVIGYHPLPRIRSWQYSTTDSLLTLQWDGPAADLYSNVTGTTKRVHGYVVEMGSSLEPSSFAAVSPVLTTNTFTIKDCPSPAFVRLRLVNL